MNKFLRYGVVSLVLLGANLSYGQSTPPVSIVGKFFVAEGKRFQVRGVTFSYSDENQIPDPIADSQSENFSTNILQKLKDLHVNAIRVFRVDLTQGHDKIMNLLAENGIYVVIDTAGPNSGEHIPNLAPPDPSDPNQMQSLYKRTESVVDAFSKYPNVLGYEVGNEVPYPGLNGMTIDIEIKDAQVEKTLIAHVKSYLKSKGLPVAVGSALVDIPQNSGDADGKGQIGTDVIAQYYACGPLDQRADYIGFNTYRYNGTSLNAYDAFANLAKGTPDSSAHIESIPLHVPILFTESGGFPSTDRSNPRDWKIVNEFFNSDLLKGQLSGEFAFGFFNTNENLGLYCDKSLMGRCDGKTPYSATSFGGAANLSSVNLTDSGQNYPAPTPDTGVSKCPNAIPPIGPTPPPGGSINITINHTPPASGNFEVFPIQNDSPLSGALKPGSNTGITIKSDLKLYINAHNLDDNTWPNICSIDANILKNGAVVSDAVPWGGKCSFVLTHSLHSIPKKSLHKIVKTDIK